MKCPECKADTRILNSKIRGGKYVFRCEHCNAKLSTHRKVDNTQYITLPGGMIRRRTPKSNLSKAEKKRRIREKHKGE